MNRRILVGMLALAAVGLVAARPGLTDLQAQIDALSAEVTGIGGREVVQASSVSDTATYKTVLAECPVGKVSLGGGGRITFAPGGGSAGQALVNSYPNTDTSWNVTAASPVPPPSAWTLTAYVVCGAI